MIVALCISSPSKREDVRCVCVCVLYLAASGYCVAGHIRDTEGGGGAGVTGEKPWWSALVTAEEASRTCSDEISGEKYHQTN